MLKLNIFITTNWFEMTSKWERRKTYNKTLVLIIWH